jgi:hypothetical protein
MVDILFILKTVHASVGVRNLLRSGCRGIICPLRTDTTAALLGGTVQSSGEP